ncbi:MAG: homoserine kinase [Candidatus Methanomethylicaceae archaeon]
MALPSVKVTAPATVANLGPGYDIIGLALDEPRDLVEVGLAEKGDDSVEIHGLGADSISSEPKKNSVAVAGRAVLERAGKAHLSLRMRIVKGVPPRRGMGSSGASSAAGAYAVNFLLGMPLGKEEILQCAMEGEKAACGSPHADNVAPALFGGVTLISSFEPIKVIRFEPIKDVEILLLTPEVEIGNEKTKLARQLLPSYVPLHILVQQVQAFGNLLVGLIKGDLNLMGRGISGDMVVEPARAKLIPKFDDLKSLALRSGAYGFSISGAGPSVFALCPKGKGNKIGMLLTSLLKKDGVVSNYSIHRSAEEGARVVS